MAPADGTAARTARAQQAFGTIVIVGGGCYGSYYLRQLRRAAAAGALRYERLLVVDHRTDCAAATSVGPDAELRVSEWPDFFAAYLSGEAREGDAIVPSPLMPHLLFQWLAERARARWPERAVVTHAPAALSGVPWQREGVDGTRYVSFAEWTCPVNCIEPEVCPHTRDARTWSLPPTVLEHVAASRATGQPLDAAAIFHCTHRAYGVGMIDVADVLAAERTMFVTASSGPASLLVGTVSHCHGALGVLSIA